MKIPKSHFSEYFKRSVVFLIKTELAVFIISIIEYLDLCTNMIDISYQIFFFNESYNYKDIKLSKIILTISPYQYFFNYVSSNTNDSGFTKNYLFIIIYAALALWFFSYFLLISNCNLDDLNSLQTLIQKISINIFDYILFRVLPIYGFDLFSREIMRACSKATSDYTYIDLVVLFFALFILGFFMVLHLIYYSKISVWSNFRVVESFFTHYPYDSFFSAKCDMIFCTLKCLITLNKNYLFYNNYKVNYISEYIAVITLVIFMGYICFILYLFFFSYQILYFFMTGFNMLRLLLLLFLLESVLVRILLNDNNDYKSFLVFEGIFLIFDVYIIFASFYNYVLSKAIKSQNYLAVCWFIQANKIDIQQFITEWIANHKTVCVDKDCEICEELIKGHISLSTIEIENMEKNNELKKDNINYAEEFNNNSHNKNNNKISKDEMNVNLIMKIYPPYQFNLKLINISLKLKKTLGEDDLIRLDFLYLTVLFLSNRNVEYRLFSKICNLIIQYSDNINVSVSLMLIFEIIRKSNLDLIKDYDLIKKNEDLRNSLKEYIIEYENFIHFGAKSPDNYLCISNKFREFKKLTKSIHTLFKKNLECNYQLIIMRYAYETLLHIKFKNMTPFDLGFFYDFLDYHFNGDKLFLLKYIIDRDTFTIIKGSKEVLKYQGNSLDTIFPDYLKEIGLNLFKNQLENVEKENQKPIFNFIIKDLLHNEAFGFVDSFKMKYFVYPTTMINELLMQATFINSFTSIMIFEEYEGEQILFSFSAQLYKYFGITPNMIYVLKKAGIIINFEILFPKKKNKNKKKKNENNLDENSYSFEYKHYYPIYKKIIECDGLNDVANYLTLKDKLNEMQQMAQDEKELIFNIHQKEKFENCGIKYETFNIKELKKKKKGYQGMKKQASTKLDSFNDTESSNEEGTYSDDDFNMKYEGKGLNVSMPTLSSAASLSSQSSIRTYIAKNKKDGKVDEKTKRAEMVNRYTIVILLFGVFLNGVSVVFLFLEVSENNKFKQLFQLFQTFKIFKRGIESSPLSLLSNYCYYSKTDINKKFSNGFDCMNFYMEYSQNISEKYSSTLFSQYPIYKIIQEEIKDKYNEIITTFNDYQKAIYNLDSGVINKISDIIAFSYSIKVDGNLVTLVKTDMNFISLCREYNNYITTLLEGDAYMIELFSLVQFKDTNSTIEMTVISEYEDSFTQTRKIMLLMLMAYPSIHIGLQKSSTIMQEEFHSSLSKIEILLIVFFILQIILHSFLILIFMMFLSVYVKMIKFNILTANKLFSDRKFLELQDKRLDQIKIISNLYQENPNKIADKIEAIDNNYRRKTGEVAQKSNKSKDTLSSQMTGYDDSVSENKSKTKSFEEIKTKKSKEGFNNTLTRIGSLIDSEDESNGNKKKTIEEKNNFGKKKNSSKNLQKIENNNNNNEDDEEIPLTNISQINNVPDKIFDRITVDYKLILFISLSIYMLYCIIFFIVTLIGCNRLGYLVNYCEVNNEIDGYLFDNFNTLLYMYITNSSSNFYGRIIYQNDDTDYLNDGINDFYSAIQEKETIESEHSNIFPPIYDIINLDCSKGMMPDDYFETAAKNINTSYEEYFKGICEIFPVATTGNDNSMLLEVLYMIDQLAHRFENVDFGIMFNQMRNSVLFDCYTLVLTLNRIIRNYFNNYIFIDEVNKQFDYFTTLTIFYLVFNMIIELIIFLILNFGIIYKIKFNNKLIMDFISSLRF